MSLEKCVLRSDLKDDADIRSLSYSARQQVPARGPQAGNQCEKAKTGAIGSLLLEGVESLTVVFCTNWSLGRDFCFRHIKTLLEKSRSEVIIVCIMLSVSSKPKIDLILDIF